MNFVEPIRDRKQIAHIKNLLKGQGRYRDLLLFIVGINTALRVSDLLKLRISDFFDAQGNIRDKFWLREEKRGKRQEVVMNVSMVEALEWYKAAYSNVISAIGAYVFFSKMIRPDVPLKRGQAWKMLSKICHEAGLRGNFGTHSLRKTWGYHARIQGVDIALIMAKLNHNSLAYTKRYLGVTDAELGEVMKGLNL